MTLRAFDSPFSMTAKALVLLIGITLMLPVTQAAVRFQRVKSFGSPELTGRAPFAPVIEGSDGALYGTTLYGGNIASEDKVFPDIEGDGVVFTMDKDGNGYRVLHHFAGEPDDGARPWAPVFEASDGALYGVTLYGGVTNYGTLFRLNKDGSGYAVLRSFGPAEDPNGRSPIGLIEANDGRLYGTTYGGGSADGGTVFKINKDGSNYGILHTFGQSGQEGRRPGAGVIEGSDGALYGTTRYGSNDVAGGTVFKLNKDGSGFSVLHTFTADGADGAVPLDTIFEDGAAVLYGTTSVGGANGTGTIFKLNKDGIGYAVLHPAPPGTGLHARVIEGDDGSLYGTSDHVFKVNKDGSGFTNLQETAISRLLKGSDGALYGTAGGFSEVSVGYVFKLNQDGSGYARLWQFSRAGHDPWYPTGELVEGNDNALYSVANNGETNRGSVFKVGKDGRDYSILRHFIGSPEDPGASPTSLFKGSNGVFYGTTGNEVFKLNADGSDYGIVHQFGDCDDHDGKRPVAGLIESRDGALYGATAGGGVYDDTCGYSGGTVFRMNRDGSGYAVLHSFSDSDGNGHVPPAGVIEGNDGALYGITSRGALSYYGGTVFKLNNDGTGFLVLHRFGAFSGDGQEPLARLIAANDGKLYGTTASGGSSGHGTIFRVNENGTGYQVIHSFTGLISSFPNGLSEGSDGALYGTTQAGGSSDAGTVFKINKDGTGYTLLHDFRGGDGAKPSGALLKGIDGVFYGATFYGGDVGIGTVFKMWPPQTPNMLGVSVGGGAARVTFAGEGGYQYEVLRSTNLNHWTSLGTITMPASGIYTNVDNAPPFPAAFYHAAW